MYENYYGTSLYGLWRFAGVQSRAANICFGNNTDTFTLADFEKYFPEFFKEDDSTNPPTLVPIFPVELFEAYVELADSIVGQCKWGKMWKYGMGLVVAHFLVYKLRKFPNDGTIGGIVDGGSITGIVSSATLGDASVKYDTGLTTDPDYGTWNYTSYGQEFVELAKQAGKGGVYVINDGWWYW